MKSLVLYGPGDFKYEENWSTPEPKEGWAIVKVRYSGVCGSDLPRMMTTGAYHHPHICGHEFMGHVEAPATGSEKFKKGDRVAVLPLIPCKECPACEEQEYFHCKSYNFLGSRADGGFAEYCLVPEENLFRLPENIDERVGAFIEPMSVALHTVRRSNFKEGSRALVFGAGAIGLLIGMWLKAMGAKEVVIASRSENSLQTARNSGFENVVGIEDKEFENLKDFDYCFEAAGANKALIQAIEKVKRKGTITIIGRDTKDIIFPLKKFEELMRKEINFQGCWGYNNIGEEDFILENIKQNKFNMLPLISKEADISEGEELIKKMFNKDEYFCKVLFKFGD